MLPEAREKVAKHMEIHLMQIATEVHKPTSIPAAMGNAE